MLIDGRAAARDAAPPHKAPYHGRKYRKTDATGRAARLQSVIPATRKKGSDGSRTATLTAPTLRMEGNSRDPGEQLNGPLRSEACTIVVYAERHSPDATLSDDSGHEPATQVPASSWTRVTELSTRTDREYVVSVHVRCWRMRRWLLRRLHLRVDVLDVATHVHSGI